MKWLNVCLQIVTWLQIRINFSLNFYNAPELMRAYLVKWATTIRRIQITTEMRSQETTTEMVKKRRLTGQVSARTYTTRNYLDAAGGNVKRVQALCKNGFAVSYEVKYLPCVPAIPFLEIYSGEMKEYFHTTICTQKFTATLFLIAPKSRNNQNVHQQTKG